MMNPHGAPYKRPTPERYVESEGGILMPRQILIYRAGSTLTGTMADLRTGDEFESIEPPIRKTDGTPQRFRVPRTGVVEPAEP